MIHARARGATLCLIGWGRRRPICRSQARFTIPRTDNRPIRPGSMGSENPSAQSCPLGQGDRREAWRWLDFL